jgi:hypothetical protein
VIVNAFGIVLSRRPIGEYDRLCVLMTENLGKVAVRFSGVERPRGKLKALSEPMTSAEFRLHLSPRSEFGKAIGGQLSDTFPAVRADLGRTLKALACCELAGALSAVQVPNPIEYRLLLSALENLASDAPSPWLEIAYAFQLLDAAGLRPPISAIPAADRAVWERLCSSDFSDLSDVVFTPERFSRLRELAYARAEEQASREFHLRGFAEKLAGASRAITEGRLSPA